MLPYQKLTTSEKETKYGSVTDWGRETIDAIIGLSNGGSLSSAIDYTDIQTNINLYNSIIDLTDLQHIINPYNMQESFPATLRNYNIIKPKIDLLLGEESKRPFNFRVIDANPDASSKLEQTREELIKKSFTNLFLQELYQAGAPVEPEVMQEQVQTPEEIEKFLKHSYTDLREHMGNQALNYLIWFTDFKRKALKNWKQFLITGSEIYYTGLISGEPTLNVCDPRFFYCQLSPESDFVEDAQYCFYERFLTPSQIYDEYHEYLTDKDVDQIENIKQGSGNFVLNQSTLGVPIVYQNIDRPNPFYNNRDRLVRVMHVCWQSLRKIGFLTYPDPMTGEEVTDFVDESFKMTKFLKEAGYKVDWKWINEVWEGTKIGADIFVNIRPLPNQNKSLDNPSKCKLPYTGVYKQQSMVSLMKPHQYFYDILFYRLEMSLARSKDKIMVMDVAQIPRSMGIDTQKWLYYMETLGVSFINSFEEGTGANAGRTSQFNQFQAVDMSMAPIMDQYIMLLNKVEDMVGEISGVSKQRQGEINTSELVGNVERSVVQSSNITEHLFNTHNEVKRRVLTNLLEVSKSAWMEGKKAQYVLDDMTRVFFSIEPMEYAEANYGLFVSNSSKDQQILESLKQLSQAALQAGTANFGDIAKILQSNSIADVTKELEKAGEKAHERNMQIEQEKTKQVEMAMADKQKDRDLEREINIRDNETKLIISNMSANETGAEAVEDNTQEVTNKFLIEKEKNQITREKNQLAHSVDKEKLKIEAEKAKEELKIKRIVANKKPTTKK